MQCARRKLFWGILLLVLAFQRMAFAEVFPERIQVKGNIFVNESGETKVFRGYQYNLEGVTLPKSFFAQGNQIDFLKGIEAMRKWGADIFRIHVYPINIKNLGIEKVLDEVEVLVNTAAENHIYSIIDLHAMDYPLDPSGYKADYLPEKFSITPELYWEFWEKASKRFVGNKAIAMYELLNEPTRTEWPAFGDGTEWMAKDYDEWMVYATETIDMIRQNDPETIVLVGPAGWCTRILGPRNWSQEGFKSDYGFIQRSNVAYAIHVYPHITQGYGPYRDPSNEFNNWEYGWGQYSDEIPIFISEVGYSIFKHPGIEGSCEDAHIGPGRYRDDIISYMESKNLGWNAYCFDEDYYHEAFYDEAGEGYVPDHVADWSLIQDANFTPSDTGEFFRSHSLPPAPKGKVIVSIQDSEGNILPDTKWQLDGQEQTTDQADLVTGATYIVSGSRIQGYGRPENLQVKLTSQGETKEVTLVYKKSDNESQSVSIVTHMSATFLMEDKAVYDDATFQQISFAFEYPRAEIETDKSHVGTFTIEKGEYSYWDSNNSRQNITASDLSPEFPLRWDYSESDYTDFTPKWENGENILFRRAADRGLRGKQYTWTLYNENYTETIPNFSTTQEQVESYVPSVILKDNAVDVSVIDKIGSVVSVPVDNRFRVDLYGQDDHIARSEWQDFAAGTKPTYSFPFPSGTQKQDVKRVQVDFRPTIAGSRIRYRWNFSPANKKDDGVSGIPSTLTLEIEEELSIPIVLADNYWLDRNTLYPVFSTDPSVMTVDFDSSDGKNVTLLLNGIKAGKAELSVVYRDADNFYYTTPIQVVVTDPDPDPTPGPDTTSSGGGGCNTGYGIVGLLIIGFALRKYLIL